MFIYISVMDKNVSVNVQKFDWLVLIASNTINFYNEWKVVVDMLT